MAHDVFISYAFADRPAALAICAALERAGLNCWIAPRDGTPGASYAAFLVSAIAESRAVVVVFSRAANDSEAVLSELEIATNRKRPILPVRIEAIEPKGASEFYLRRRHWIDARPEDGDVTAAAAAIVAAVPVDGGARIPRPIAEPVAHFVGNLPHSQSSFVGRTHELQDGIALLDRARIVTLWGPGGSGKTRLALEIARGRPASPDGTWFIDLSSTATAESVARALADALGIRDDPATPLEEALIAAVSPRTALYLFDNCEHVLAAVGDLIARLAPAAPGLQFLCTSREPLAVAGEHVRAVGSLNEDAVTLFIERAAAAGATAEPQALVRVRAICAQLDGIPLAIELAAARARTMSLAAIEASLSERFRFLAGNKRAPTRQQTLRGTLDWSFALLDEAQRAAFAGAAVFVDGWSSDAFATILGDPAAPWDALDTLAALVDKSLVAYDGVERYHFLETTRAYAHEIFAARGDEVHVRHAHSMYFAERAIEAAAAWRAATNDVALNVLRPDRNNVIAAMRWAFDEGNDLRLGMQVALAMEPFWQRTGAFAVGIAAITQALDAATILNDEPMQAALGVALGSMHVRLHNIAEAHQYATVAVPLARKSVDPTLRARALFLRGSIARHGGVTDEAESALNDALSGYRALNLARGVTACLGELALVAGARGDLSGERRILLEIAETAALRGDARTHAAVLISAAETTFALADADGARSFLDAAIAEARAIDADDLMPYGWGNGAAYDLALENGASARIAIVALLDYAAAARSVHWMTTGLRCAALLQAQSGRLDEALAILASAGGLSPNDAPPTGTSEAWVTRKLLTVFRSGAPSQQITLDLATLRTIALLQ